MASYYFREVLARDPFSFDAWLYLGKVESERTDVDVSTQSATLDKLLFARHLSKTLPVRPFSCCPSSLG